MKFLVDNQLPASLALFLRKLGYEAEHVLHLGMGEAGDLEIAAVALKRQSIIITKDGDFGALSVLELCKVPIIWVRLGNCRKPALFKAFSSTIDSIVGRINAGDMLIELYD